MDSIWFFGCSLTYGSGLTNMGASLDDRWSTLVCNHFGRKEENYGEPGASNEMILLNIRNCYDKIQPNDWVVLESTFAGRSFGYHKETDLPIKFNRVNPHGGLDKILQHFSGKSKGEKYGVYDHEKKERIYIPHSVSSEQLFYDLAKYCANVRLPYLNKWRKHYFNEFNFYTNILKDKAAKVIYWDYDQRYEFESIKEATNGKIDDYHFSPKGNKDFSVKIINELVAY